MEAVNGLRHEYSESLVITTGVPGDDQEASFMNATLQSTGNDPNLEFSVAVHVGVPSDVRTEAQLCRFLYEVFTFAIQSAARRGSLNVEIQLGPEGRGEEE